MTGLDKIRSLYAKMTGLQRSTILALFIKITAAGLGFITQIFLARVLGADEYGIYSYAWTWIIVGGTLLTLGYDEAATRFIAEYRDKEDYHLAWGVINVGLKFVLFVNLSAIVFLYILISNAHGDMTQYNNYILIIALASVPVLALQYLMECYALAFSWSGLAQFPPFVLRQLLIFGFVLALLLFSTPVNAGVVLLAALAAGAISVSIQIVIFWKRVRRIFPKVRAESRLRNWLKTSLPMFMASGFQIILTNADIIILGMFLDPSMVALYFAATRISTQIGAVSFSVRSVLAQRMAGLYATNKEEELNAIVHKATKWIFWPTVGLASFVLAVGWYVLWLFGEDFTEAYPLLPVLALGVVAHASVGGAEDLLRMTGFERQDFIAKVLSGLLNIALNFVFIPHLGIYGAALATTLSMICYAAGTEYLVRKHLKTTSFIFTIPLRSPPSKI